MCVCKNKAICTGKYLDQVAQVSAASYIPCAAGKYSMGIGLPSATACISCPSGTYSLSLSIYIYACMYRYVCVRACVYITYVCI